MLKLVIPKLEWWDDEKDEFVYSDEQELHLEHSLVSLSKWESKWEKPFLEEKDKTSEMVMDYVRFMTLNEVSEDAYSRLGEREVEQITDYINAKMTATWFSEEKKRHKPEIITAEIVYYWMITLNIPVEFQHWHFNRLLTLVKVCQQKSQPDKKMSRREVADRNRRLNEARKAKYNTPG